MRLFPIDVVLTVARDVMLVPSFTPVQKLVEYMVDTQTLTHEMSELIEICGKEILRQYPHLKDIKMPENYTAETMTNWLKNIVAEQGMDIAIGTISEEVEPKVINSYQKYGIPKRTVTLKFATKPDVPNANGYVYSASAYEKAMERYNESIKKGISYVTMGYPTKSDFASAFYVEPNDIHSVIKSVSGDEAVIEPITDEKFDALDKLMKREEFVLGARYIAPAEDPNSGMHILSFSIIPAKSAIRS